MLFLAAVILGNYLATTAVKDLADRARPMLNSHAASLGPSFPSGHTAAAASFYAAAALVLGRQRTRPTRARFAGSAVALAVAVAASCVLLDDHWLSDVIAALALGWAWFRALRHCVRRSAAAFRHDRGTDRGHRPLSHRERHRGLTLKNPARRLCLHAS